MIKRIGHSDRIKAGIAYSVAKGRHPGRPQKVSDQQVREVMDLSTSAAAGRLGISKGQYHVRRRRIEREDDERGSAHLVETALVSAHSDDQGKKLHNGGPVEPVPELRTADGRGESDPTKEKSAKSLEEKWMFGR